MREVVIVSAVRTPMGSFMGKLSTIAATQLGAIAIKGALEKINLDKSLIDEIFFGNVLQAGVGQAPARQAALAAGLSENVVATTVNKVCASGLKAVIMATQAIKCGDVETVVAGGMESMSQAPHYLIGSRNGKKLGDQKLIDGLLKDGLTDVYSQSHMGNCGEICAKEFGFSREDQDNFAIQSYTRAANAWKTGKFKDEIIPVPVAQSKGEPVMVTEDEEYTNVNFDRLRTLSPAFQKDGTVTAGNASTLSDGASALVLMSLDKAKELGLKPLAKIVSYADAAHQPERFTVAPAKALQIALKKANITIADLDFVEFNEAFSVVGLANTKILSLDPEKVNIYGGAVALGHPLGSSGSRILVTLINVLKQNNGKYGATAICNGGGGASSLIIENLY